MMVRIDEADCIHFFRLVPARFCGGFVDFDGEHRTYGLRYHVGGGFGCYDERAK